MPTVRISDTMRYLGLVPQYNTLLARQLDLQQQVASGNQYSSADQNPVAVAQAQRLHTQDAQLAQDLSNGAQANTFMQMSESAISSVSDVMQRTQELAVSAGDATKSDSDLQAIAQEVDQLLQQMIDTGNATFNGRSLFAGTKTTTPAFQAVTDASGQITSVAYTGNTETMSAEIAPGESQAYNLLGSNTAGGDFGVFQDASSGVDVFQTLINFRDDLNSGNRAGLSGDAQAATAAVAHIATALARVGGMQDRITDATTRQQNQRDQLASTLSQLEDTDVAKAATDLNSLQIAYQAAVEVGAKIGQVSLLNYMQ